MGALLKWVEAEVVMGRDSGKTQGHVPGHALRHVLQHVAYTVESLLH